MVFAANMHKWSSGLGDDRVHFWGQDVKGQGHMTPNLDFGTGRDIICHTFGCISFSVIPKKISAHKKLLS